MERKRKQPEKQAPKQRAKRQALPVQPQRVDPAPVPPPRNFPLNRYLALQIAAHLDSNDLVALLQSCRFWWQTLDYGRGLAQAWIFKRLAQFKDPAPAWTESSDNSTRERLCLLAQVYRLHWDGLLGANARWTLQTVAAQLFPDRGLRNQVLHKHRLEYLACALEDAAGASSSKRAKRWAGIAPHTRLKAFPALLGYAALTAPLAWLRQVQPYSLFGDLATSRMPPSLASSVIARFAACGAALCREQVLCWLVLQQWPLPLLQSTLAQLGANQQPVLSGLGEAAVGQRCAERLPQTYVAQVHAAEPNVCAALLDNTAALCGIYRRPTLALLRFLLAHTNAPLPYDSIIRALPDDACMGEFPLTADEFARCAAYCFGTAARRWWLRRARVSKANARLFRHFVIAKPRLRDVKLALQRPGLLAALVRSHCRQPYTSDDWSDKDPLLAFLRTARRYSPEFALDNYAWIRPVGDYRALVIALFDGAPPRALLNIQSPISPHDRGEAIFYRLMQEARDDSDQ